MSVEQQIKSDLQSLIDDYESNLTVLHNRNMSRFDTTQLPSIIQDMVKLAVTKSPSFSNVAALSVTNFVLSHLFGQIRPTINDPVYSDDSIGVNTYGIILSRSGSGKDRSYNALLKAVQSASDHIESLKHAEMDEKYRAIYIKQQKAANPDFNESEVQPEHYADLVPDDETTISSMGSSRGGISTSLIRMSQSSLGNKSIYASELGLAIQANQSVVAVLELLSILFDMGNSVNDEFKTADAKEKPISGMFPNFLGISSPTPFYQDGPVRKLLVPLLTTSLARRTTVVFSDAIESFENKRVPLTVAEKRVMDSEQRLIISELTQSINQSILDATKQLIDDKSIMFDEAAAQLYDDYKGYMEAKSDLLLLNNGESVEGIEMAGRAFKMGRIAALWALAQNKRIIDYDTLLAAIYFSDYTAQHLIRFAATLELKDYELFINDWENGFFGNTLPVDQAITSGYVSTKQMNKAALESFLRPVNAALAGRATVSYNDRDNAFVFVPVQLAVEDDYSYRATKGITEHPINHEVHHKSLAELGLVLGISSTFNPFLHDSTRFICLTVSNSFLSMQMVNRYLSHIHHFISTVSDPDDFHSFNLILPLNSVINQSDYKFVCMSIAEQLLLRVLPEYCEPTSVYHGFDSSTVLSADSGASLFDCSGILGNLAAGAETPTLRAKPTTKPSTAVVQKYVKDDIIANKQTIVDIINASSIRLAVFASLVYDLKIHFVPHEQTVDLVNSINAELIESIPESTVEQYLIEPFTKL